MPDNDVGEITGVILVGGKSRRMGQDKAFLDWQGKPLFEMVLSIFRECFAQILLIGDNAERFARYGLPVLPDIYPGSALGGLYTGLFQARTDYVFVSACDMPFPSLSLLRHLCSLRQGHDAVVPRGPQALEPLFALYAKNSLPYMKALLEEGNLRVYDLYPMIKTRFVADDELTGSGGSSRSLVNLNTPEEAKRWRTQLTMDD